MKLFEKGRIGKLTLKNRIMMAPMGLGALCETNGKLSRKGIDFFVARAKGGAGLIRIGFTRVSREFELLPNTPFTRHTFADDRIQISWMNELAQLIHDYRANVSIQLTAGVGRIAGRNLQEAGEPIAPSKQPCFWAPHSIARELSIPEIERLIKSFEKSAKIVKSSGIDAIELHGHEGYLFDQFKTSLWNKRTDKYGGSLDNRLRFSFEVINAIKKGAGKNYPVIYRLSLAHFIQDGREIEEGIEIAQKLESAGIDALDIDAGCYESWYYSHPPTTLPLGVHVELAKKVKQAVNIPVIAVGKLGFPNLAEDVLQKGKADFIALGRPLLADPEWPNKVRENRIEDIRPCIGCHEGCLQRIFDCKYISCAVNPTTGMEKDLTITRAKKKKNILVIGGGVGGMEAARVSALRGHKVNLWEKDSLLGGNFKTYLIPDFKIEYKLLVKYLSNQIKKHGVRVKLNYEATKQRIQEFNPDVIFMATGSKVDLRKIKVKDNNDILTCFDVFDKENEIGKSVVVIGGGLIGCEIALHLANVGKDVTIIEQSENVASNMFLANRMHLVKLLYNNKVKILTKSKALEINSEKILIENLNKERSVMKFDSIIIAIGLIPNRDLLNELDILEFDIFDIGDCVKPRKVINVIWDAYRTARLI